MIVIAPLSNDVLRDWPRQHYASLIDIILEKLDHTVVLIGSAEQRQSLNLLVRSRPANRVINQAGLWTWAETIRQLATAELIVANNSGIAHLGARLGRPTLCLFAASHDPHEWGPRGPHAVTLYVKTACAPCAMATINGCGFGHVCMTNLKPEMVFDTLLGILSGDNRETVAVTQGVDRKETSPSTFSISEPVSE